MVEVFGLTIGSTMGFLLKPWQLFFVDGKLCSKFREMLEQEGVHCVRLPPRSPNLTPHMERFMRSIKEECLLRMIFFGETSLRRATTSFLSLSCMAAICTRF